MLKQWTSPQNYRCPRSWRNMETQTGCLLPGFDLCTGKSIVFSLLCQNRKDPLPIQPNLGFRASQGSHGQLGILPRVPATGTAWKGTGTARGTEGLCCTQSSEGLQGILSWGIQTSGRGRKAQLVTQHKTQKTSSSLKQNNAQNWVLGTTSLRFVIQAEQCSLIFIQICNSLCSHIYLVICYCQILDRKNTGFDLFLGFLRQKVLQVPYLSASLSFLCFGSEVCGLGCLHRQCDRLSAQLQKSNMQRKNLAPCCHILSQQTPRVSSTEASCALGNPQPFQQLLDCTGEPRQHILSRQISFAHQHLSEQLLQLLAWNANQLFQKIYQQNK